MLDTNQLIFHGTKFLKELGLNYIKHEITNRRHDKGVELIFSVRNSLEPDVTVTPQMIGLEFDVDTGEVLLVILIKNKPRRVH